MDENRGVYTRFMRMYPPPPMPWTLPVRVEGYHSVPVDGSPSERQNHECWDEDPGNLNLPPWSEDGWTNVRASHGSETLSRGKQGTEEQSTAAECTDRRVELAEPDHLSSFPGAMTNLSFFPSWRGGTSGDEHLRCHVYHVYFCFLFVCHPPLPRYNHTEYIYQCRRTMLVISAVELAFNLLLLPWVFGSVQDSPARYFRHDRSMSGTLTRDLSASPCPDVCNPRRG